MALVVTVAGATSDSYATLAEAATFLDWRNNSVWDDASDATQELWLKAAARLMDLLPYTSQKSDTAQARRFPSSDMVNASGALYIPDRLKEAQCILAMALGQDPNLENGGGGAKSVSVTGSFSVTFGGGGTESDSLIEMLPNGFVERMKPWLLLYGPGPSREWSSAGRGWK